MQCGRPCAALSSPATQPPPAPLPPRWGGRKGGTAPATPPPHGPHPATRCTTASHVFVCAPTAHQLTLCSPKHTPPPPHARGNRPNTTHTPPLACAGGRGVVRRRLAHPRFDSNHPLCGLRPRFFVPRIFVCLLRSLCYLSSFAGIPVPGFPSRLAAPPSTVCRFLSAPFCSQRHRAVLVHTGFSGAHSALLYRVFVWCHTVR